METLKKTLVFFWYVKSLDFVLFWSFFASLARFCVKKTLLAAPFVISIGNAWRLAPVRPHSTTKNRGQTRMRLLLSMSPIIERTPARLKSRRYHSTFPPLARQYHLEHPSGGMHRAGRPESKVVTSPGVRTARRRFLRNLLRKM